MAKMQAARAAWRALCKQRRAAKREAEKLARAAERAARKAAEKIEAAALKAAERADKLDAAKTCKHARNAEHPRRPVGRPPKPRPRPARWTDYRPGHARKAYHAIRSWEIERPSHAALAAFFGTHINTIPKWLARHAEFARAVDRAIFDRAEMRAVVRAHRRVTADHSTFNFGAKSARGVLAKARVQVEFDHAAIKQFRRTLNMRRRRGRGVPEVDALCAIQDGARIGRVIADALGIAESTLRLWRKQDPDLDRAIRDGVARQREHLAEQARQSCLEGNAQYLTRKLWLTPMHVV